jgi:hypothetical protein
MERLDGVHGSRNMMGTSRPGGRWEQAQSTGQEEAIRMGDDVRSQNTRQTRQNDTNIEAQPNTASLAGHYTPDGEATRRAIHNL